ncbi:hypothetical protein KKF59_04065 [Patescibacteria group bacterium]|nr:hypothetical protein [Patescibacteria group bacterium]MBU1034906.1 hypothetical protein [Patescibacteria group bacterium]MBU1908269.1 hypothetical protein [Patescibacteria group bacterium]
MRRPIALSTRHLPSLRLRRAGLARGTHHFRSGNILPLALIMTFTILLAGLGIATVVLEDSHRARDIDDSVAAYYMADSGIERQLFEIRKRAETLSYAAGLSSEYPNAGKWVSTAAVEQVSDKKFSAITENDFRVLDLFDPDNLGAAAGVDEIQITWDGSGQLEVGYAQWQSGATVMWPSDDAYVVLYAFAPSLDISLDPTKAYRLRLKALNGDVSNVTISVFNAGAAVAFPGDITLSAEGTYGKATQKIVVSMPKQDVLSGLYNYVLFSECQLLKGVSGAPICP